MDKGLYDAAKAMHTKIRNIEIISNNLANVNTTGYKREVPFSEYLNRAENITTKQITDFRQGNYIQTDDPLNLALSGNAFFMVETERGVQLTRNGAFKVNDEGELVTKEGLRVLTRGGSVNLLDSIVWKSDKVTIRENGEIRIGDKIVDQLMIARIDDQRDIRRSEGQYFYKINGDYKIANEDEFKVSQGYLEESNTNPFVEMQEMILLNNEFQTSQKVIKSFDTMLGKAQELGRV